MAQIPSMRPVTSLASTEGPIPPLTIGAGSGNTTVSVNPSLLPVEQNTNMSSEIDRLDYEVNNPVV